MTMELLAGRLMVSAWTTVLAGMVTMVLAGMVTFVFSGGTVPEGQSEPTFQVIVAGPVMKFITKGCAADPYFLPDPQVTGSSGSGVYISSSSVAWSQSLKV